MEVRETNLYSFLDNGTPNKYDLLGLLSFPLLPYQYACSRYCKGRTVSVSYTPGHDTFEWGWLQNRGGSLRFGNNIHVTWTVDGNPNWCKYFQREAGFFYFHRLESPQKTYVGDWDPLARKQVPGNVGSFDENNHERFYIDELGATFDFSLDQGTWYTYVREPLEITFECEGSDGSISQQTVSIPDPPNIGPFPPPDFP